jgi:hypothetical protein
MLQHLFQSQALIENQVLTLHKSDFHSIKSGLVLQENNVDLEYIMTTRHISN